MVVQRSGWCKAVEGPTPLNSVKIAPVRKPWGMFRLQVPGLKVLEAAFRKYGISLKTAHDFRQQR